MVACTFVSSIKNQAPNERHSCTPHYYSPVNNINPMKLSFPTLFSRKISWSCALKGALPFLLLEVLGAVHAQNCNPDVTPPVCNPPASVTVTCEAFDPSLIAYGQGEATDNCCVDTVLVQTNLSDFDTLCLKGNITRTFIAKDCAGNTSTGTQTIKVNYNQDYYLRFPDDVIITGIPTPGTSFGVPEFFKEDCELLTASFSDQVFVITPNSQFRIERTWSVINWCTYNAIQPFITVPNPTPNATAQHPSNLVGPTVSMAGSPSPWQPTISKLLPNSGFPTDFSSFWAPNANGYNYTQTIWLTDTFFVAVEGMVFLDTLDNCVFDAGEHPLEGWTIRAVGGVTGNVYAAQTDQNGHYLLLLSGYDTIADVHLVSAVNAGLNCPLSFSVQGIIGQVAQQDFPVKLASDCSILAVDLGTPRLRRCFPNTYSVQVCNQGGVTAQQASVEVTLDDYFVYNNSAIVPSAINGNTYTFPLGDLSPGECISFYINFTLSCQSELGQTHCTEAHAFPDTFCRIAPQWSGAVVDVAGACDGDSIRLHILNVGTGNMQQPLDFVVVEDVIMREEGQFQLQAGDNRHFVLPANGATWRLQAQQEPFHPWGGIEAVAIEGCGGLNTPGLVTLFALNTPNPAEAIDCQENLGAYDPNDIQAFPGGYGAEHFLEANTDITYLIRFQNTGTDTAFNVVVLDTLPNELDPASVRPGASSHPYGFSILDGRVLQFRFEDILLPDSNVNQLGSNGFVRYHIEQQPNLPDGTFFGNRAAIFFDFNDPVITNTAFHTIGTHFITVSVDQPTAIQSAPLRVYPNPSASHVYFELPLQAPAVQNRFVLRNAVGQEVRSVLFEGQQYRFDRGLLPAGVYFYDINQGNNKLYSGRIVLK
jgi:uncharacterized repeat protein (TIGR01451 family)